MAIDLKQRWGAINRIAGELQAQFPGSESCFIVSLTDEARDLKGGSICECHFKTAAKALFDKTHSLATPAQVVEWRAAQAVTGELQIQKQKREKREFDMEDAMNILALDRRAQAALLAEAETGKKSKS
jgi:hypothetical protein